MVPPSRAKDSGSQVAVVAVPSTDIDWMYRCSPAPGASITMDRPPPALLISMWSNIGEETASSAVP